MISREVGVVVAVLQLGMKMERKLSEFCRKRKQHKNMEGGSGNGTAFPGITAVEMKFQFPTNLAGPVRDLSN
jgi:hypothetical protein